MRPNPKSPAGSRPVPGSRGGFTLLEVLVSLFVLAVGLLGFAALQAVAARSNANGGVQSRAVSIGQGNMEWMKTARFDDLTPGGTLETDCDSPVQVQTPLGVVDFYTVECTFTRRDNDSDGQDDQVDLLVTITYPGAQATWPVRIVSSRSRR